MSERARLGLRPVSGLRTRFSPKSRIGQGLISIAPWLDVVLLLLFFLLIDSKIILQPGIMIQLPQAPRMEASRSDLVAVIKASHGLDSSTHGEILFFNDERFVLDKPKRIAALQQELAEQAGRYPDQDLVILADRDVRHGTITMIYELARAAGIERINSAVRPAAINEIP